MRSTNRSRVRLPTAGLSGTSFDRLFTRTCVSATRQYSTWYRRKLSIGKKVEHGSEGKGEDSEKKENVDVENKEDRRRERVGQENEEDMKGDEKGGGG